MKAGSLRGLTYLLQGCDAEFIFILSWSVSVQRGGDEVALIAHYSLPVDYYLEIVTSCLPPNPLCLPSQMSPGPLSMPRLITDLHALLVLSALAITATVERS